MFDVNGTAIAPALKTLRPISDRLVIRPIAESDTTTGGLFKPDIAKEAPQEGEVIAMGPGRTTDAGHVVPMPSEITVGSRVLYGKYSGTRVTVNDEELLVIRVTDVLCDVVEAPQLKVA